MKNNVILTTKELLELNKEYLLLTKSKVKHKRLHAKKVYKIISDELLERNIAPYSFV